MAAKKRFVEAVSLARPIDRASPSRLWFWACVIALVGVCLRLTWFDRYGDDLILAFGSVSSGHLWFLPVERLAIGSPAVDSFEMTRAFAPGYGLMLRGLWDAAGDVTGVEQLLVALQSLIVAAATLVTVALSKRVLFGYSALLPAALITASVALIELPGGMAPQLPLMLLLVLAVWLITLARERVPDMTGLKPVLCTLVGGLLLGAAILFNPAVLLLALFVCWWAFRGLGREHATLLVVAVLLLPACWMAVVHTQAARGIPTAQLGAWTEPENGEVADSVAAAGDRAYAVVTPWNPRFARGQWSSMNWNYEWLLPFSVRGETTYQSATRVLAAVLMIGYLLLVLGGVVALFAEGAGAASRLIALPVLTLPLATFVSPIGNLVRVSILPFLMIALVVGAAWLLEIVHSGREDQPSE